MFGNRLKELRLHSGNTQKDLAQKLQISTSTLGMYEIGRRQPDTEILIKIAEFFHCSADYLLGLSETKRPFCQLTPEEEELLMAFRQMRSTEQRMLHRVAESISAEQEYQARSKE